MAATPRFTNRREIIRVIRSGRTLILPIGRVSSLPATGSAGRILFVVPKAVSKKSSVRNRIRRVLAAWARERNIGALLRRDIVVSVHPLLAGMSPRAIRGRAEAMAERLGVFPRRPAGLALRPAGPRIPAPAPRGRSV